MYPTQRRNSVDVWPGWVDGLSSLLMVVIFVLMIFVVAQFFLANQLSGRDEQLGRLNAQIAELTELLGVERAENQELESRYAQLSSDLQLAVMVRDELAGQLSSLEAERQSLSDRLAAALDRNRTLEAEAAAADARLADAFATIEADREKIELQLQEIASLQNDIRALRSVRDSLETQVAALELARRTAEEEAEAARTEAERTTVELRLTAEERDQLMEELSALRDRSKVLEARLSDAEERTTLAQREVETRDIRIEELVATLANTEAALDEQSRLGTQAQARIAMLTDQINALRDQLQRVEAALGASEETVRDRDIEIANLNARLNQALVRRVEELSRYRSEFFGRLREVLGERDDIRVVGDRFVFQSEVLFPSASATLQPSGRERLAELASTLMEIARDFPPDIDWVLRVDGHTDRRPINTFAFPSNWELSTARATEVVKFLIDQGVPPERLAAAGFADQQPLDPADTEAAYERNRRIELKLDQR